MAATTTAAPTTRHVLRLMDLRREEIDRILLGARRLKAHPRPTPPPLERRTLAMIFAKSSTRTRVSFEVAMAHLGGQGLFLSARDLQLGRGEPVADTARVLSRYVDAILIRTFAQAEVEELAAHSRVPVINGLTDSFHPCQVLADLLTVQETFGPDLARLRIAWVGDGNNMANTWLEAAALYGFELRLACPDGYDPDPAVLADAQARAPVSLVRDPAEAVAGAHVINTDVWASMGQEGEAEARRHAFRGYTVDAALLRRADPSAIVLHCLPAHRGEEITADVLEGPQSRVWDEAENRLHAQKALLLWLLAPDALPA